MHTVEHSMKFLKEKQLSFVLAEVLAMKKRLRISIPTMVFLLFLLLLLVGGVIQLLLWVGGVILSLLLWVDGMALSLFLWVDGVILSFILWVGEMILSIFLWVGGVILSVFLWIGGVILWVGGGILSLFLWVGGVILSVFLWMGGVILWAGEMILSLFLWVGGVILSPFLWMGGVILWIGEMILSLFLWVGQMILSLFLWLGGVILSVFLWMVGVILWVGGGILSLFLWVGEVILSVFLWMGGVILWMGEMILFFFVWVGQMILSLFLWLGGVILSLFLWMGKMILWAGEIIFSLFLWVGGVILSPFLLVGRAILSLFFWVGGVILSVCRVVLSVCKVVVPFPLLVGGMLLSLRFFIMVGDVVVPLILLWVSVMVLYFLHMLVGGLVLLLLLGGVVLSSLLLYVGRCIYNARGNLSSTGAGITLTTSVLHCQFLPLLKDPQVFQNIEQEYGVKFNVKLPNGSTKPIATFTNTIASMMSGSYPLTIESIFDYLSSSVADVISWSFFDGQFKPMSPTDSAEIEKLYQQFLHQAASHAGSQLPYSRKIGEWNYSYDFDGMVQTNTKTRKKRKIKRIPALDSFSLCLSCRGLKDSVHTSIASLHEKLKGMIIKKTFGDCSTDIVEPIIKLARSFCVKVDSSLDSIVISGGSDYLAKVFLVLRQKQMSLESTSLLSFPPEWEPQTENIELKSVPVSSSEGAKVVSAFKKTMNSNISKIERIQNKFLYTKYDLCKKRMHEKNNGRVNEKWLFHGSRSVPPETIYKSEHGFDFRHGAQGMWGRGAYFAVNAKYSGGSYAFNSPEGRQIFLAFVLTGDSIAMQSNRLLVTPPRKEDGSGDYDSVNGVTGSSQIYIVYDHDKCYPAYLITFQ
ncbi:PREDICTED: uncharacterized protein LOC105312195 [Amphimedon queenslandica]|uniref:Poly [ADP-ribose] polymerase n=1 Tax=Amphimedon queenslandica TaxID=400682 RepID=A0AAN0J0Q0_AMPQE|nr:PREDICTED: uncharacterized protein LOC105312195 [Amphimedon queenslandica]|eukprot:XP_019850291.1 PREDICTED: uncharacterized protein LOC105312195 [Amphimedon queenslandica]